MEPDYAAVLAVLRREDAAVRACVRVGSRVYGTAGPGSDHDFLVVLRDPAARKDLLWGPGMNLVVHGAESYASALASQSIFALEAHFAPAVHQLKAPAPTFAYVRDRKKLRAAASERAESDWRKAEKGFADDPTAARKRAVHALRVLAFATQIARGGRIDDFTVARGFAEIVASCTDWPAIEGVFVPLRDGLLAELARLR
ncbi:MAG: nucleotidyltransferase domain-containing protein [Polyangiaceae bacterium]|nr:nucleotidyltransferase domain-containing protein [Polyangiaceae bacterium]